MRDNTPLCVGTKLKKSLFLIKPENPQLLNADAHSIELPKNRHMEEQNNSMLQSVRVQKLLDTVPLLFRKFTPDDIRAFLLCGDLKEYEHGDIIISENDGQINYGCLITEGTASLYREDVFFGTLKPGDFMGETFLFRKRIPLGTLVASGQTSIIKFNRESVLRFFEGRSDRLFKLFIVNLLELQNQKLILAGKKILYLHKKVAENSNES
jgi:CRP-like cAMP-binding protein